MLNRLTVLMAFLCWTWFAPQPAMAHKLLVMAWIQGDQLVGEAAHGDGSFAANARVALLDGESGAELLSFSADEHGDFQTPLPAEVLARGKPLLVRVEDGAGHRAEYVIDARESAPAAQAADLEADPLVVQAEAHGHEAEIFVDQEMIARMVREAVRQEVAPLRREIIALSQSGPGISEVLGGIGYIIGLAGLGFWLLRRR